MNTKITFFWLGLVTLLGVFGGANMAAAQSVVTTCTTATFNGSVTPNGGATDVWFNWGTTASLGYETSHQTFTTDSNFSQLISNLVPGDTYYYRAMASNSAGTSQGTLITFMLPSCGNAPVASLPSATTNSATNISTDRAALNAFINPNGTSDTTYWFQWGTSSSLGNTTSHYNQGAAASNTTLTITGLSQNTTYYYRVTAQNAQGIVHGSIVSFTTTYVNNDNPNPVASLPSATTNSATNISTDRAALNAFINPNGTSDTTYWFQWGTSSSLSNSTSHYNQGAAASNTTLTITGLSQNTTYYYRVTAQNAQGIVHGSIVSFTTTYVNNDNPNPVASLPSATTNGVTNVAVDFVTLNGYVNPNGTNDTAYWFEWGTSTGLGNATSHYSQGSSASNISTTLSGLNSNTTYYYRAVAQNAQGIVRGSILSFTTVILNTCGSNCNNTIATVSTRNADVSGDFAVLNGYVDPNGTNDTVRWFEWGGSQSLGNSTQKLAQGSASSNFSGTLTSLVSNTTYYYRAAARNSSGTVYGSILSFTTGYSTVINTVSTAPTATTLLATEVARTSAKLNGLVFTSASQPSNAWFEWGTNTSLGNKTQTFNVGSASTIKHSDFITGLSVGQTYYYRITAENPYGKSYGAIMSFVAEGSSVIPDTTTVINTPVRTTTVQNTTIINQGSGVLSLVSLSVDGGAEVIVSGEKRGYHIVWKNESAQTLKNVILRVTLPASMNFESATNGSYSSVDNTVTVDLKTLDPKQSGELFVFATANRKLVQGTLVVVTANMVYTNPRGVQGDAIAYATHRGEVAQSSLGANLFGAGSFLPSSLFEWILLLILVLILVLLANHLYGRFADEK